MPKFQFDSVSDFLAMGGYAGFVWCSYLAFFVVVLWSLWQPQFERRRIVRLLRARTSRQQEKRQETATQQSVQQQ